MKQAIEVSQMPLRGLGRSLAERLGVSVRHWPGHHVSDRDTIRYNEIAGGGEWKGRTEIEKETTLGV